MNLFVEFSAYFAAPFLAELIDANFYVMNTDFNDFFGKNTKKGIYCGDKLERINNDDLIIN